MGRLVVMVEAMIVRVVAHKVSAITGTYPRKKEICKLDSHKTLIAGWLNQITRAKESRNSGVDILFKIKTWITGLCFSMMFPYSL